jgi:hypothetical protein
MPLYPGSRDSVKANDHPPPITSHTYYLQPGCYMTADCHMQPVHFQNIQKLSTMPSCTHLTHVTKTCATRIQDATEKFTQKARQETDPNRQGGLTHMISHSLHSHNPAHQLVTCCSLHQVTRRLYKKTVQITVQTRARL